MQQKQKENCEEEILEKDLESQQMENGEMQTENEENQSNDEAIIASLECKLQENEQRFLRLQADFDNYKKRAIKEKEDIYKFATEDLVNNLLPVLDNFERALTSIEENGEGNEDYVKGIQMVYQQLMSALEKEGLKEIKAVGEVFDPNYHHAVAQESKEDCEDNSVIEVFQKGYILKKKVIRPSMVKVCIH